MTNRVNAFLWQRLLTSAQELGFVATAAAPDHLITRAEEVSRWVAEGHHADMAWYARALEKRLDLQKVLPGAASVIVMITPYEPKPVQLAGKKLARYAAGDDYHDVLKPKLWQLIELLREQHPEAEFRPYVDTGPVLERYWAERAGLGWIGKNGNLINRRWGSYVFIACIVTDLIVPYGEPHGFFCGNCRACIDACPTDAIVREGVVDSRRCISYLSIEQRGPFAEGTPGFADWLFGCDICQEVCPWTGKFSAPPQLDAFRPRPAYQEVSGDDLRSMVQEDFSFLFRKSPVKRTKMAGLKRNLEHLEVPLSHEDPSENSHGGT